MKLSIIIVNYKVKKDLIKCLDSIKDKIRNISYEIIIVENDVNTDLSRKLSKYKKVKYLKANRNLGFGGGNNFGSREASGDFLFFLNPDTIINEGNISELLSVFDNKKVGMLSPLLLDTKEIPLKRQGTKKLDPKNALFALSFLSKVLPYNPIADDFWIKNRKWDELQKVESIPGSAFIIRRSVFEKVGGFDEQFFLYFEEDDLCNRISSLGFEMYIDPRFKIVHKIGSSTEKQIDTITEFKKSRYIYFRKYYGVFTAEVLKYALSINSSIILFSTIFLVALLARLYKIRDLMIFISDQGWFYISAQKLVSGLEFPLVGITSSHTWLHQGAYWTYILAVGQLLFGFDPVVGSYIAVVFGLFTLVLLFLILKNLFNVKVALIASFIYATSPLMIVYDRFSYHTNPIPLFVLIMFYFLQKFYLSSKVKYLYFAMFFLGVLYNFELATQLLIAVILGMLVLKYLFNSKTFTKFFTLKNISIALVFYLIPLIPILIFDVSHGFKQTIVFGIWMIYKPFSILFSSKEPNGSLFEIMNFMYEYLGRLVFPYSKPLSLAALTVSLSVVAYKSIKGFKNNQYIVLLLFNIIPILGVLFMKVNSEAYLPMILIPVIVAISVCCSFIKHKSLVLLVYLLIFLIGLSNLFFLIDKNYYMNQSHGYGIPLPFQISASQKIIEEMDKISYRVGVEENGRLVDRAVENYKYILFYLNKPVSSKFDVSLLIYHYPNGIQVKKIHGNKFENLFFIHTK